MLSKILFSLLPFPAPSSTGILKRREMRQKATPVCTKEVWISLSTKSANMPIPTVAIFDGGKPRYYTHLSGCADHCMWIALLVNCSLLFFIFFSLNPSPPTTKHIIQSPKSRDKAKFFYKSYPLPLFMPCN